LTGIQYEHRLREQNYRLLIAQSDDQEYQDISASSSIYNHTLTINFNIPHGIASSMPLLPLLEINKLAIEAELDKILLRLKLDDYNNLMARIRFIPKEIIKYSFREWGIQLKHFDTLVSQSFTKGRIDNNIVDLSKDDVYSILQAII